MNVEKKVQQLVRGWLPKGPRVAYASKVSKPRWRKPQWIALSLVAVIALVFAAYTGVQTFIRYSNPQTDVTASYFEKSLNCTTASVGDVVEVTVLINWHGYIIPEFKREVKMIDPFPENAFQLVSGNNSWEYRDGGGGYQFKYLLKVTSGNNASVELPNPKLYLDNTEIPLTGTSTVLDLRTVLETGS